MMKSKASLFLKQIISVVSSIMKAKSMALKGKTSAMKSRLIVFSLLKNKKVLMGSISHKLHALMGQQDKIKDETNTEHEEDDELGDQSKAIVLYNRGASHDSELIVDQTVEEDEDKYPDLTHTLFDSDGEDYDDQSGSVIDLVRNSKENAEDFRLEDEIDHVADLFIRRFHRRIKMQKLESFKRYQEMLERSI